VVPPAEPEKPAVKPPTMVEKMLGELTKQIAVQNKRMEAMEKRLPAPEPEDAKIKAEEEAIAKKKLEDDESLATYREILEEKFNIKEGVETLAEAKTALKVAKANKLGLQTLSEKMKSKDQDAKGTEQTQPKGQSYFDTTRLKEAIKNGE
jgi:hypothetical protein